MLTRVAEYVLSFAKKDPELLQLMANSSRGNDPAATVLFQEVRLPFINFIQVDLQRRISAGQVFALDVTRILGQGPAGQGPAGQGSAGQRVEVVGQRQAVETDLLCDPRQLHELIDFRKRNRLPELHAPAPLPSIKPAYQSTKRPVERSAPAQGSRQRTTHDVPTPGATGIATLAEGLLKGWPSWADVVFTRPQLRAVSARAARRIRHVHATPPLATLRARARNRGT